MRTARSQGENASGLSGVRREGIIRTFRSQERGHQDRSQVGVHQD